MAADGNQGREQRGGEGGPDEAASYLQEAVGEMAQLARRHRLDMLGYLLEMAYLEAREQVQQRKRRAAGSDAADDGAAKKPATRVSRP